MKYEPEAAPVSPRTFEFLSDNSAAHHLIETARWQGRRFCPRCKSVFIKKVNTNIFRELYRCVDCGYMYNSLSGTVFQGAKIPLVKYLQLAVVYNALGEGISMREISYVIDVSYKTAVSLFSRLKETGIKADFAFIDKPASDRFKAAYETAEARGPSETFFSYCEMKYIVVDEAAFLDYLHRLTEVEVIDGAIAAAGKQG